MNSTAIVPTRGDDMFLPVMNIEAAIARRNDVVEFTRRIMVEGTDFGKIPGAGDKPTLLKPGAEKLATFFGLTPIFIPVSVVEDWTGDEHKGEPFFYYRYRCELHRNGNLIASSEGSCNTWESKYRYRKGERVCPHCGQAAIIKGKEDYGGGWICFAKKGGCGAKFKKGDASIEGQDVGRILNPDVADLVNTVQKMAQKRALIAATLLAVNASEFYTQDIEDMVIEGEWVPVAEPKPTSHNAPETHRTAQDGAQGNSGQSNPFDDATPYYVRDWQQLTGAQYDLVDWIRQLHRKPASAPCSAAQYGFVTGIVDELTHGQHGYILSLLCQAEIGKDNKPSKDVASALLKFLAKTIKVKDAQGNEVDAPNPQYRADMAEMITAMSKQPAGATA